MKTKTGKRILFITQAGVIAALYFVLVYIFQEFAAGPIQIRIAEALCILAAFTPAAIPGLFIGCFFANLVIGCIWSDIIFGSVATLIGAVCGYFLRKKFYLVPLPTVLANVIIVPFVLKYGYKFEDAFWFFMVTVGAGEIITAYVLGILLYLALKGREKYIFPKLS